MAATLLFLIMAIVAAVLLVAASVTATIGAIDISNSIFFNTSTSAFTAHQHLTIAAALGWSALAVLIIILIVAAVTGGFKAEEVSSVLLTKTSPTKADLIAAYKGERELEAGHTTQIIILIVLIIIGIIALVIGIEGIVAAIAISNISNRDDPANAAYAEAIATAVIGVGGMGALIVAIIAYIGIRSAKSRNLEATRKFIDTGEKKLGVTTGNTK